MKNTYRTLLLFFGLTTSFVFGLSPTLVKDINPSSASLSPIYMTNVNGTKTYKTIGLSASGAIICGTPSDQNFGNHVDNTYSKESITYECITYEVSADQAVVIDHVTVGGLTSNPLLSGSAVILLGNVVGGQGGFKSSSNANNFKLASFNAEFFSLAGGSADTYHIVGYDNGVEQVRVSNFNVNNGGTHGTGNAAITWTRTDPPASPYSNAGTMTFGSDWGNIDEVQFILTNPAEYMYVVLDNIDFATAVTPCSAPTSQATMPVFGTETISSLRLASFTSPAGGAVGYAIYINSSNSFTAPTNGTTPTLDTSWNGAGQQPVYFGTSATPGVTITGLNPGTTYYFQVYAYNDCSGTETYETTGLSASDVTAAATPHSIRLGSGQNQSTPVNSLYPVPLVAIVEDVNGNRLPGIAVKFTVPGSGPSLTFNSTGSISYTTNTNINGAAITSNMTPSSLTGSFHVSATVEGTSLSTSTLFQNLAVDLIPPIITNSSILGGSQSITATQVIFRKDFDEMGSDITQDDFELITTGTVSGTISDFSEGLAGIRSRVTITVGNITGDGTISIKLKTLTDITDVSGNGNGTNGYATQAVSSTIHNVQFTPTETQLSLAGGVLTIEDTAGGNSNDDLTLTVSGTFLILHDPLNVLGGAGTAVDPNTRSIPLSSISSIVIDTQSGTDSVTLSAPLAFTGNGGIQVRGNANVIQTASMTLENGQISYQVSGTIRLQDNAITVTGSGTVLLMATVDVILLQSIRSLANGDIHLVSGWDGTTAFDLTTFNAFSSVASLTAATPFGNNNGTVSLGDGTQTSSITIGSKEGATAVFGFNIVLTAGNGGTGRFAQLGFQSSDQGSSYTISGTISLRLKNNLRLNGGSGGAFNYAQIGHIGADTTSDSNSEGRVTANIVLAVGGNIVITGGVELSAFAQLGHGGYNAIALYLGIYQLLTPEVRLSLEDGSGNGYSRLGNDDL